MIAGQGREDPLLDGAGVLILVDQQVVEPAGLVAAGLLVGREQLIHEQQQVVEVHGPGGAHRVLVAAVAGGGERPRVVGVAGHGVERAVGADRPALPAADSVEQVAGAEDGVGHAELLERGAGGRLLLAPVHDRKPLRQAELGGVPAQDPHAQRVDRGDFGLFVELAAELGRSPGEHLAGRLVRERHGQDARRPRALADEVGDPRDHHPGFARAGTGEHEKRAGGREHGLGLGGVEPRHAHAGRGTGQGVRFGGGRCHRRRM